LITATASVPLIAVNALASAIWVGGLVAIFVAARAAWRTLDPAQRVAFFRSLGRTYGVVGTTALLVAILSGEILLGGHPWDGLLIATAILTGALGGAGDPIGATIAATDEDFEQLSAYLIVRDAGPRPRTSPGRPF
jgi:hypothetical protein